MYIESAELSQQYSLIQRLKTVKKEIAEYHPKENDMSYLQQC